MWWREVDNKGSRLSPCFLPDRKVQAPPSFIWKLFHGDTFS